MVSEGDRSPPVAAAAKKEPPSAKRGRVVVCEHGRTRKTTVRCCDLALESRTTSHVFSPPGPPFRPLACQNVGRVVTSHGPPSDPARKPRNRAKGPQGHPPPGCLIFLQKTKEIEPGGAYSPCPVPLLTIPLLPTPHLTNPTTHHTRAHGGAADFPCLRQLPPPPEKSVHKHEMSKTCSGAGESKLFQNMRPRLHQSTISHARPRGPRPPLATLSA